MCQAAVLFPHQLFEVHPALAGVARVVLVEEPLLFSQYRFHRQKLLFHRASMKRYAERLRSTGLQVDYLETPLLNDTTTVVRLLSQSGIRAVRYVDACDDWLSTHFADALQQQGIRATVLDDPHFLTPTSEIERFAQGKRRLFFTEFYVEQRKRLGILLDQHGKPIGGKWSFDPENRKKLPRGLSVPPVTTPREDACIDEARSYVRNYFPDALGNDEPFAYPTDHASARAWLREFVRERLPQFGDYEDAISRHHQTLFHSMLTPMLNIGLLSPQQVLDGVLAEQKRIPLNSLEGFVRQVIGWREFVRLVYLTRGRRQRCRNFWGFHHPMPRSCYEGTTGVEPVDEVIRRVLRTGYCHHIERLMILGNFFLLCEIHPDAVYQWFMELFIDAYDWVMVPNVYGMSQHADGGLMTTKPYISGSSYLRKMSDFPAGPWCRIWDALYWRFVDRQEAFFAANPRMAVMVKLKAKLGNKLTEHHRVAEAFLEQLHSGASMWENNKASPPERKTRP